MLTELKGYHSSFSMSDDYFCICKEGTPIGGARSFARKLMLEAINNITRETGWLFDGTVKEELKTLYAYKARDKRGYRAYTD